MAQIKTLPLYPGAKFIVVDDGQEVMRSQSLIFGWLQMWKEKGLGNTVEFLLFSGPKSVYEEHTQNIKSIDFKLHDYYTVSVEDKDKDNIEKLKHLIDRNILQDNSVIVIDCLSTLILTAGLSRTLSFVDKLSSRCAQLICIYRRDFGQCKIPRVDTLGTTYVRLKKAFCRGVDHDNIYYEVLLKHRKQGGGILHHNAQIMQKISSDTYEIVKETIPSSQPAPEAGPSHTQEKPQASFRIAMNAREQEQRKNTPLPYGLGTATHNESQILYQPDSVDDLDEEDPDDDLPF